MKQILLAIDGNIPTDSVFQYAVGLCRRIQADLNILQFVKEERLTRCLSATKKKVGRLGKLLEDSFAEVAFAEEGLPMMGKEFSPQVSDSLNELIKAGHARVALEVTASNSSPEKDLPHYIDDHQDIVLAIFDPSTDQPGRTGHSLSTIETIKKKLRIPLVVVKTSPGEPKPAP